ncbi:MAG: hypothetical protein AAF544_00955 [Bacteroidota bacterium]
MTEARFQFYRKWLTYANALTLGIGLLAAFAIESLPFSWYNAGIEATFFDGNLLPAEVQNFKRWTFAVIGSTIAGFQLLIVLVSEYAFRYRQGWAWWAISSAFLLWFCLDSSLSIYYGAWFNVLIINLPALLLVAVPLVATKQVFFTSSLSPEYAKKD